MVGVVTACIILTRALELAALVGEIFVDQFFQPIDAADLGIA